MLSVAPVLIVVAPLTVTADANLEVPLDTARVRVPPTRTGDAGGVSGRQPLSVRLLIVSPAGAIALRFTAPESVRLPVPPALSVPAPPLEVAPALSAAAPLEQSSEPPLNATEPFAVNVP